MDLGDTKFNRTNIVLAISIIMVVLFFIMLLLITPTEFYDVEFDDFTVTLPSYAYYEGIPDGALISDPFNSGEILIWDFTDKEFDDFIYDSNFYVDVASFNDTHHVINIYPEELISDEYGDYVYLDVLVPKKDFDTDTWKLKTNKTEVIVFRTSNHDYKTFLEDNFKMGGLNGS